MIETDINFNKTFFLSKEHTYVMKLSLYILKSYSLYINEKLKQCNQEFHVI